MANTATLQNTPYHVYIVECADKTLYTGITTDIEKRIHAHNSSNTGAKYTRYRRPVALKFSQEVANKQIALKLEARIKSLSREKKYMVIAQGINNL